MTKIQKTLIYSKINANRLVLILLKKWSKIEEKMNIPEIEVQKISKNTNVVNFCSKIYIFDFHHNIVTSTKFLIIFSNK